MQYRRRAMFVLVVCIGLIAIQTPPVAAQNEKSVAAAGDSITKGFNAQSAFLCPNSDQEQFNWATSDTNGNETSGNNPCTSFGSDRVFSLTERLECNQGGRSNVISPNPNQARSGAQMLKDFFNQAMAIKTYISAQPAPRLTTVLLGHNDICGGKIGKFQFSCDRGSDQDRNNYCRTTPAAFEREFRKGLDILITVPDMKIGVASLIRVSELCNFSGKQNCQLFNSCQTLWTNFGGLDAIFGGGNGICGSLTFNCSDTRVADAYTTALAYRNILQRVTAEYAAIPSGGASRVVTVGGQMVGGVMKASGSTLVYSDATWRYKFASSQLSCCDCFHPSRTGQDTLARIAREGLRCTGSPDTCCRDTGNSVTDGRCSTTDTSGTFYPGFF
jgi:lysophospholipase L1-like esterase